MRKHLKSVAVTIMAVFMMMSVLCVPAMAAELSSEVSDTMGVASTFVNSMAKQDDEGIATRDWPWWNLVDVVASYSGNPTLVNQQMLLGNRYFSRTVKGVAVTLTCNGSSSAEVNFYIRNMSSGKIWRFSGKAGETTTKVFSSDAPAANYQIWSESVTYAGAYSLQIRFVAPKT